MESSNEFSKRHSPPSVNYQTNQWNGELTGRKSKYHPVKAGDIHIGRMVSAVLLHQFDPCLVGSRHQGDPTARRNGTTSVQRNRRL